MFTMEKEFTDNQSKHSVITTQLPELPLLTITAKKAIQMQRYLDLFEVRWLIGGLNLQTRTLICQKQATNAEYINFVQIFMQFG